MRDGDRHRSLSAHLAGWTPEQITQLLLRRPDLAGQRPPADLRELAQRAQHHPSVVMAIDAADLPENRLLQLIVCCPRDMRVEQLAAALPGGVSLDDVEPVLASLEEAALVWRHDGRISTSGVLRSAMPTTLGPPLARLAEHQSVDYLRSAIAKVRSSSGSVRDELTVVPWSVGSRSPRKPELVEHLAELLATPGVVAGLLRNAPDEAWQIAEAMADGRPSVPADSFLRHSSVARSAAFQQEVPTYWLFERALLLPDRGASRAWQPREVGVALRDGKPVADLALHRPALATRTATVADADAEAVRQAVATLDALADLLQRWTDAPVKQLKSGGLGVAVVKQAAGVLDVTPARAAQLIELAHLAGLLDVTSIEHYQRRKPVREATVGGGAAAAAWLAQPPARRWRQVALAWLRAEHWPSASGRKSDDGTKSAPVFGYQDGRAAPALRRDVLAALASLGAGEVDPSGPSGVGPGGAGGRPGADPSVVGEGGDAAAATDAEALAGWLYWLQPQRWSSNPAADPPTAVGWIYDEAELLGIAALGRLSGFGRVLVDAWSATAGAAALSAAVLDEVERRLAAFLPDEEQSFTLQADMTAVVVGRLDRDVLGELRLLADIESTGAATTFRFSEATVRRAVDAGREREGILDFLRAHATKGVPQALEYMVSDVARRHGHLTVGVAQAFVTSDDPGVLADACSHRRTRKLGLQLLAPTVAVSAQPPGKVLATLREAGFLPVAPDLEDERAAFAAAAILAAESGPVTNVIELRGGARQAMSTETEQGEGVDDLPEPFRQRVRPVAPAAAPLSADDAARLAKEISAGLPVEPSSDDVAPVRSTRGVDRPAGRDGVFADADLDRFTFELIVQRAASTGGVLGLVLVGEDEMAPLLIKVTGLSGDAVVGADLLDGTQRSIDHADISEILELGNMDGLHRPDRRGSDDE